MTLVSYDSNLRSAQLSAEFTDIISQRAPFVARSTPDLLGLCSKTNTWSAFEAKGKVGPYSSKIMEKAKKQARQVGSVDGSKLALHVGTQLYRNSKDRLKFAWEDPPVDDRDPIDLFSSRDMWRRYIF